MGDGSPNTAGLVNRRALVVLLVVSVPCLVAANRAGTWVAQWASGMASEPDKGKAKPPPIIALPESLDFGVQWETDALHWDLVFQNVSDAPAVLGPVRGACSCTTVTQTREIRLNPGDKTTVTVVVDLLGLRAYDPSEVRGVEIEILATAGFAGAEQPMRHWNLRGGVRRLFNYEPMRFDLSEDLVSGETGRSLECRLTANGPLGQLRLKRVPDGWAADLAEQEGASPPSYILRATPCKRKLGTFSDEFVLEAMTPDGRMRRVQSVMARGRVTDAIEVLPRPLDFGKVAVGATIRGSLWVRMRNGAATQGVEIVPEILPAKVVGVHKEATGWRIDLELTIDAPGSGLCKGVVRVMPCGLQTEFVLRWYGAAD